MHRTDNHITSYRCKDVQKSFSKHRAEIVAEAERKGAKVLFDDGVHFRAECFNSSRERQVFIASPQGAPFVNGPSVCRRYGRIQYESLFLPKGKAA